MNEPVRRFIENDGIRLCVERHGRGPHRVLFAHGWISSRRMWYDVVKLLSPEKYTLDLLDFRGCGLSDRPAHGHDLEGYASDLRSALSQMDGPATVVAHSMGGKLAQFIASERPANLARLILVAPGIPKATRFPEKHRQMTIEAYGSRERIERFQRAAMAREPGAKTMERIVDDALIASTNTGSAGTTGAAASTSPTALLPSRSPRWRSPAPRTRLLRRPASNATWPSRSPARSSCFCATQGTICRSKRLLRLPRRSSGLQSRT